MVDTHRDVAREAVLRIADTSLSTDEVKKVIDVLSKGIVREKIDRLLVADPDESVELVAQGVAAEAFASTSGGATVARTKLARLILVRIDTFVRANRHGGPAPTLRDARTQGFVNSLCGGYCGFSVSNETRARQITAAMGSNFRRS